MKYQCTWPKFKQIKPHYIDANSEVRGKIEKIKLFQDYQGVLISQNQTFCITNLEIACVCIYISAKLKTAFLL